MLAVTSAFSTDPCLTSQPNEMHGRAPGLRRRSCSRLFCLHALGDLTQTRAFKHHHSADDNQICFPSPDLSLEGQFRSCNSLPDTTSQTELLSSSPKPAALPSFQLLRPGGHSRPSSPLHPMSELSADPFGFIFKIQVYPRPSHVPPSLLAPWAAPLSPIIKDSLLPSILCSPLVFSQRRPE